jgi:hypothetical protein
MPQSVGSRLDREVKTQLQLHQFTRLVPAARRKNGLDVTDRITEGIIAQPWSMIRKSGNRFSEKIMLKQRDEIVMRFRLIAS